MDEKRKQAYRYLLYKAMVYGKMYNKGIPSFNPFKMKRQLVYVANVGAFDYWLHNLAYYNYTDEWDKFREDWFWEEYKRWIKINPNLFLKSYKEIFEEELNRLNNQ